MKQYTLQQINDTLRDRYYITRERFFHYLSIMYGYEPNKIQRLWKMYEEFPVWGRTAAAAAADMEDIFDKVATIVPIIANNNLHKVSQRTRAIRKQVHYRLREGEATLSVDINLNSAADVILYAKLLQQENIDIVAVLDFVERISGRILDSEAREYLDCYDGDILTTIDESYSTSHDDNIYVCDDGVYRRLLYTKGRGYLRNGEPDYDYDNGYDKNILTCCKSVRRIGNIYIDASVLVDKVVSSKCAARGVEGLQGL